MVGAGRQVDRLAVGLDEALTPVGAGNASSSVGSRSARASASRSPPSGTPRPELDGQVGDACPGQARPDQPHEVADREHEAGQRNERRLEDAAERRPIGRDGAGEVPGDGESELDRRGNRDREQ